MIGSVKTPYFYHLMAKQKNLKRIVTRNGGIRYYENGKRLKDKTGRRKYIKQTYAPKEALKKEDFESLKTQLTPKELLSLKRLEAYKKGYKYRGFANVPYAYVEILRSIQAIPQEDPKNKDLYNYLKPNGDRLFPNYDSIRKAVDDNAKDSKLIFDWCNEVGLPGYRGRDFETFANPRLESIVDIVTLLDSPSFRSWKFMIYDTQGDEFRGRVEALIELKKFEITQGTIIQNYLDNSAFMRFCYSYQILLETKTIFIDLTDLKPDTDITDYFKGKNTTAKQSVTISNKFKDCIITVDFS